MSTKIKFNWLLLGFMGCLLGLGPAAHHVRFLGLHTHGHFCDPSHDHLHDYGHASEGSGDTPAGRGQRGESVVSCSCEHHSKAESQQRDGGGSDVTQHDIGNQTDACRFCKFFDDLQVVIFSWEFDPAVYPTSFFPAEAIDSVILPPVPQSARGPPSIT